MNLKKAMKSIHEDWDPLFEENNGMLISIFNNIYFNNDNIIFPKVKNIFRIFKYMTPTEIKVLILGQDPYIGSESVDGEKIPQAEGLSFSVPKTHRKIPPSLKNMYKEIKNSYPECEFENGNLKRWVKNEFIFLLNSSLTVVEGMSNSHQKHWTQFTDRVIEYISDKNEGMVFLLMGANAISKKKLIDSEKHHIITCVHPSPLSANRGFFDSKVFEKTDNKLKELNKDPIKWSKNMVI
jgi:uracil-DNA glycosylase|tara:strand:+ start:348 stop:1061 length:714 start_codon:yes stop_codon:yes gene_type:complete